MNHWRCDVCGLRIQIITGGKNIGNDITMNNTPFDREITPEQFALVGKVDKPLDNGPSE